MNASDLVELAGLVSSATPTILARGEALETAGGEAYWTACRCRMDRWGRALKQLVSLDPAPSAQRRDTDGTAVYVCEEILLSEILARVWTGACAASDQQFGRKELELIARSVLISQLESRRRVLGMISSATTPAGQRTAKSLDHLRRVCERWADLLLAPLAPLCDLELIAHDRRRVLDFAQDVQEDAVQAGLATQRERQFLLVRSLREAFKRPSHAGYHSADLNSQIAAAVLSCLGAEAYSGEQPTADWHWRARLSGTTQRAEQMVAECLRLEA